MKACILTENEEAITGMCTKEEKKRKAEKKKRGRASKVKRILLPNPASPPEEKEDSEQEEGLVLDDSSEYSDEVLEDPLNTPASYPFKEKEFQLLRVSIMRGKSSTMWER